MLNRFETEMLILARQQNPKETKGVYNKIILMFLTKNLLQGLSNFCRPPLLKNSNQIPQQPGTQNIYLLRAEPGTQNIYKQQPIQYFVKILGLEKPAHPLNPAWLPSCVVWVPGLTYVLGSGSDACFRIKKKQETPLENISFSIHKKGVYKNLTVTVKNFAGLI